MSESNKLADWERYYKVSVLKFNALRAVHENDPNLLEPLLKKLGLRTAADVIKACDDVG